MDTSSLRAALEDAGLSQYQATAYTTLLEFGSASATEIADACSVPPARIYDVLRDLESKGYIETYEQDSLHARAHDPEGVLSDLRSRAETMSAAAEEIQQRWERPPVDQHRVSIVKRFDTVWDRTRETIADASNQVLASLTPEQYDELRPVLKRAYERDVQVYVSIHTTDPDERPDPADFAGVVTEARLRTLPTPFLVLVDRSKTGFAPHKDSLNEYGVLVEDRTLSYVFHWYYNTCLWGIWDVIYDDYPDSPPFVYTDLRRCIRRIDPALSDDADVFVSVEGMATSTGEPVAFEGRVVDLVYSGATGDDGRVPLSQLAGEVSVTVETPEGERKSIGGWGAVIEDVEATRIVVEAIERRRRVEK